MDPRVQPNPTEKQYLQVNYDSNDRDVEKENIELRHKPTKIQPESKKASKPVTQISGDSSDEEDSSEIEDLDALEEIGNDLDNVEDNEIHQESERNEFQSDSQPPKQSSREAHQNQKILKAERKSNKPHFELLQKTKKLWENVRNKQLNKKQQEALVQDIIDLMKDQIQVLAFKHDASRIVQTCLKYGSDAHRNTIAQALNNNFLELSKAKYVKNLGMVLLKNFTEASQVLEEVYSQYSNAGQKSSLVQEFYGPQFALFKGDEQKLTLKQILEKNPLKRQQILKDLSETLVKVLDKGTINHSIVHHALLEYITNATETPLQEMIGLLKELTVEILHTKEGAKIAQLCLLHGSVKDRKVIIKSYKPFVSKIAKEQHGFLVLIQAFDVVDDTVLLEKLIIAELLKDLKELVSDKYARRVLGYILVGRSKKYLSAETVQTLVENDQVRESTSRKDPELRAGQLRKALLAPLSNWFDSDLDNLLRSPFPSQLLGDLVTVCRAYNPEIVDKLVENIISLVEQELINNRNYSLISNGGSSVEEVSDQEPLLYHITANRVIKSLISFQYGEENPSPYATKLLDILGLDNIFQLSTTRASFIVLALLENSLTSQSVKDTLSKDKSKLEKLVKSEKGNTGTKLIVEKL